MATAARAAQLQELDKTVLPHLASGKPATELTGAAKHVYEAVGAAAVAARLEEYKAKARALLLHRLTSLAASMPAAALKLLQGEVSLRSPPGPLGELTDKDTSVATRMWKGFDREVLRMIDCLKPPRALAHLGPGTVSGKPLCLRFIREHDETGKEVEETKGGGGDEAKAGDRGVPSDDGPMATDLPLPAGTYRVEVDLPLHTSLPSMDYATYFMGPVRGGDGSATPQKLDVVSPAPERKRPSDLPGWQLVDALFDRLRAKAETKKAVYRLELAKGQHGVVFGLAFPWTELRDNVVSDYSAAQTYASVKDKLLGVWRFQGV